MRKNAFTLAEVLITLGIIGVVAVLTLPNLMSDYRKKTYVAQLQRVYNQIQTAAQNCMADEDVDDLNDTYLRLGDYTAELKGHKFKNEEARDKALAEAKLDANSASAGRFLKKYFRVTKDCGNIGNDSSDCLAESYKGIDGNEGATPTGYCVNVNTGSTICMNGFEDGYSANFYVDTNGKSGPNTFGRDVFNFSMNYRGDLAEQGSGSSREETCGTDGDNTLAYAAGCFDKIISDGWKMDY